MTTGKVHVKVLQQTKAGETNCGDSYFYVETDTEFICVLADGLGSGEHAKESSEVVIDTIKNNLTLTEEEIIRKCAKQLQGKRGVVLGILKLNFISNTVTYTSIGNIGFVSKVDGERRQHHIPERGFLAGYHQPLKKVVDQLHDQTIFILYSDGVLEPELFKTFIPHVTGSEWLETFPVTNVQDHSDDVTVIGIYYKGNG